MTGTTAWMTTGRRLTAHILETATFSLCGIMPEQWNAAWSPAQQLRYDGRWHEAPDGLKRCRKCVALLVKVGG